MRSATPALLSALLCTVADSSFAALPDKVDQGPKVTVFFDLKMIAQSKSLIKNKKSCFNYNVKKSEKTNEKTINIKNKSTNDCATRTWVSTSSQTHKGRINTKLKPAGAFALKKTDISSPHFSVMNPVTYMHSLSGNHYA